MTIGIVVGVYIAVHVLGAYLLHASGVAQDLFGRYRNVPDVPEPRLTDAFMAFMETHTFWETSEADDMQDMDDVQVHAMFWNEDKRRAA